MKLFYTENINQNFAVLEKEELQHAVNVLRLKIGDTLDFTDGKGFFYKGKIQSVSKKEGIVEIIERKEIPKPDFELTLAVAPTKNISRFEWVLEKCTEIGITAFVPIISENSERRIIKPERLEKVIISACKQSLKAHKPRLEKISTFSEIIKMPFAGKKYIAHCCEAQNKKPLTKVYERAEKSLISIGPEGDFSLEEIKMAEQNNFKSVSLGSARLRTETAAIVACHSFHILNEMK